MIPGNEDAEAGERLGDKGVGRRCVEFAGACTLVIAGTLLVPLLGLAWLGCSSAGIFNDYPFDDWSFNKATWTDQPDQRGRMYDSLRDRLLLEHPSRDQVRELLGPPDDSIRKSDDGCWSYYIGSWSGLRIDTDALYITFSHQGQVEDAWRVQY